MTATKIYTREDVRDLWRRYQHGDMAAGYDFALIANAQGQTFQSLKAEIEPECCAEDAQAASNPNVRAEQQRRAGIMLWQKTAAFKQRSRSCPAGRRSGLFSKRIQPWRSSTRVLEGTKIRTCRQSKYVAKLR